MIILTNCTLSEQPKDSTKTLFGFALWSFNLHRLDLIWAHRAGYYLVSLSFSLSSPSLGSPLFLSSPHTVPLNLEHASESLGGLAETLRAGPHPRVSNSIDVGRPENLPSYQVPR